MSSYKNNNPGLEELYYRECWYEIRQQNYATNIGQLVVGLLGSSCINSNESQ